MTIDQEMETLGEVGVLMNMGADNAGGEILKTLLSASKGQKQEKIELNVLQDLQDSSQSEEQLVLQIEVAEPVKSQFLQSNDSIIQHIPITYLTTDDSNLTPVNNGVFAEPVTYVLSRDVLPENRYPAMARNEPQKIILVQEIDANGPQSAYGNPGGKPFAVKDRRPFGQCGYSEAWSGDRAVKDSSVVSGSNGRVFRQADEKSAEKKKQKGAEDSGGTVRGRRGKSEAVEKSCGGDTKVQKKMSSCKKPINKRKNSKLKNKAKACGKASLKKAAKPPEEQKAAGEEKDRQNLFELTKLEDNVSQVAERLKIGCECSDSNCFDGLNPDDVFKHRLNIADLTKPEHDMYLMGVIMASIHNLEETCRHKERIRIRSCYAYQGKKVCLTAFLYLQHVTLYQMKRLRSHLKNHGVSPRIHGNRGRKPANTLSLDIYRRATNFIQSYIEKHCVKTVPNLTTFSSNKVRSSSIAGAPDSKAVAKRESKVANKMTSYHLPPECTKRRVHREYKSFCENLKASQKVMKYSTFTNFLKKQFPNVKFHKREEKKQERTGGKTEESERWKSKETRHQCQETERKPREDQGVDKSIQVDKSLTYVPVKTQIVVDRQWMELYDGGGSTEKAYEVSDRPMPVSQSYSVSQTQNTDQYYAIDGAV